MFVQVIIVFVWGAVSIHKCNATLNMPASMNLEEDVRGVVTEAICELLITSKVSGVVLLGAAIGRT